MLRLAIDAGNLVRDRRGLGRVTRSVIRTLQNDPEFALTLLAESSRDRRELAREFEVVAISTARSAARRDRYDAVWYPFNGMRYAAAAPAVVLIADVFAFTHAHPERIARAREQAPMRRAARDAARVVTGSRWAAVQIARNLPEATQRIAVLPLVPDAYWQPGPGGTLPSGIENTRFALVVGVREARKNVRLAIAACSRAFCEPDQLLVLVGELSPADTAFARSSGVRVGSIAASDATLRTLYRTASVVLVPSHAEGFGLVAAEALACGAPVIASNASALPEVIGDAAISCDPSDVEAWTSAIRAVYADAEHATALRAHATAYAKACDRSSFVRGLETLLREVARG